MGIIFISHRLDELFEICDSITVLRDGQLIKTFDLDETTTIPSIVELMLGRAYNEAIDRSGREIGGTLLETRGLADREHRVTGVDMTVRRGEIVGLSGLVGAGKTELCKTLFGAFGKQEGELLLNGRPVQASSPAQAVKSGMAFIPEERRKEGILVGEPVVSNLSLATLIQAYPRAFGDDRKSESQAAEGKVEDLKIKTPSIRQRVGLLSGGNQQKVTIGKWLDSGADLYIFDEPTKGIDVGTKSEIYKLMRGLADGGIGVIVVSSEMPELLGLCDRIAVMADGRITEIYEVADATEEKLAKAATGETA